MAQISIVRKSPLEGAMRLDAESVAEYSVEGEPDKEGALRKSKRRRYQLFTA